MPDIAMQLTIEAAPETVYTAISTADGIHGWFTATAAAGEGVGSLHELEFPGVPGAWRLRVTEAEPGKRLVLAGENGPWTGTEHVYEISASVSSLSAHMDCRYAASGPRASRSAR